ncbi:MAG: ATP-binding protein, partial [Pseudomonadota bacterium]
MAQEVAAILQPIAKANENEMVVCCPQDIGLLKADIGKLQQIILNLLSNANKFTHQGTVRLDISEQGKQVLFKVIDSGIGIPANKLAHIFEPFNQADSSTTRQ